LETSKSGAIHRPRQLRNLAIYEEGEDTYLLYSAVLYSVAEEHGITIAKIEQM